MNANVLQLLGQLLEAVGSETVNLSMNVGGKSVVFYAGPNPKAKTVVADLEAEAKSPEFQKLKAALEAMGLQTRLIKEG